MCKFVCTVKALLVWIVTVSAHFWWRITLNMLKTKKKVKSFVASHSKWKNLKLYKVDFIFWADINNQIPDFFPSKNIFWVKYSYGNTLLWHITIYNKTSHTLLHKVKYHWLEISFGTHLHYFEWLFVNHDIWWKFFKFLHHVFLIRLWERRFVETIFFSRHLDAV